MSTNSTDMGAYIPTTPANPAGAVGDFKSSGSGSFQGTQTPVTLPNNIVIKSNNLGTPVTTPQQASTPTIANNVVNGQNYNPATSTANPTVAGGFVNNQTPNQTGAIPTTQTPTEQSPTNNNTQNQPTNLFDAANNGFLNSYKVTKSDIRDLEKKTNLSLKWWPFGELCYIKHYFSNLNSNTYYLLLSMLVYGFDFKVLTSTIVPQHDKAVIDLNFISDFKSMVNDPVIMKFLKKTPAYQKGCFDNIGAYGVTHGLNSDHQPSNPITGPQKNYSSLTTSLLDGIHSGATQELENFCNKIRTHAYLSLPKGSFGSLQRIISGINGVITSFQKIISDLYQGCIKIIQKMYAVINGIMVKINQAILSIINKIIPLDLLCLILDTLQVLMDDIGFFTSLFQMSGSFITYFNSIQATINGTSAFLNGLSNQNNALGSLGAVTSFFPPQVQSIVNMVNITSYSPEGFLADKLTNYGYGAVLEAMQGNLVGALISQYGAGAVATSPLASLYNKAQLTYAHFGQEFPLSPSNLMGNTYSDPYGRNVDINGNPVSGLAKTFTTDFSNFTQSVSDLFTGATPQQQNETPATAATQQAQGVAAPAQQTATSTAVQGALLNNAGSQLG